MERQVSGRRKVGGGRAGKSLSLSKCGAPASSHFGVEVGALWQVNGTGRSLMVRRRWMTREEKVFEGWKEGC